MIDPDAAPVYERHLEDGTFVFAVYRFDAGPLAKRLAHPQAHPAGWSRATVYPDGPGLAGPLQ